MLLFHFDWWSELRHRSNESRSASSGHSASWSASARWSASAGRSTSTRSTSCWWHTSPWRSKGILFCFISCPWSNWRSSLVLKIFYKILDGFFIRAFDQYLFLIFFLPNCLSQSSHESFVICRLAVLELFEDGLFDPYCYFDYLANKVDRVCACRSCASARAFVGVLALFALLLLLRA
jgi:hypothetical protein